MSNQTKIPSGESGGSQFPPTAAVEAARGAAVGPAVPNAGSRVGGGPAPEAFSAGAAKSAGANGSHDADKPNPAAAAFASLKSNVEELKEYASYYMAAKSDGFRQSLKNVALYAGLGVLGMIIGAGILVTASVLLVLGIAHGLATLFGSLWLGELVTAIVLLGGIGIGAWLMIKKITGNWKTALKKKYEERKASQRARFGRDVADRARGRKSPQSADHV